MARTALDLESGILDGILRRGGEIVVLQGCVASGKTTALHEFAERAADLGTMVLHATGARTEVEFQYGVIRQLFSGVHMLSDSGNDVAKLLDDGVLSVTLYEPDLRQSATARVMEILWNELLALYEKKRLAIVVDDVHLADTISMECLLYFARRLRTTGIPMIVAQDRRPWGMNPTLQAELLRLPNCRSVNLRPLSQHEVAALVSRHSGIRQSEQLVVAIHRASGGNPLLAQALIADYLDYPWKADGELVTGDAFERAVQSCLSRCDTKTLRLAQAFAVLGVPTSASTLGRMLGLPLASVAGMIPELAGIGLISAGRFRHPAVRAAVLSMMPPGDLAALHTRAAHVLHEEQAASRKVAEHLVAVGDDAAGEKGSWTAAVLREAANEAMIDCDPGFAARCLRLALPLAQTPAELAGVTEGIAAARWLADPAAAMGYLPELGQAVQRGHLTGPPAARVVHHQVWAGWTHDAVATLNAACHGQPDAELRSELLAARLWVSRLMPGSLSPIDSVSVLAAKHATSPHVQVARLFDAIVTGEEANVAIAAPAPAATNMDDTALAMAAAAMAVGIGSSGSEAMTVWSDIFRDPAGTQQPSRHSPTSRALLAVIRGAIYFRLGDLRTARALAREAIAHTTPRSWGVLIGLPVVVLTLTAVTSGELDEAAGYLGMPVPEAMFATILGPLYLYARGHYHLAAGKPMFALRDFETCGQTARQWGVDHPGFLAWRLGAAEACLGTGAELTARELLAEHISLPGADRGRTYAAWLRVRAAASPLPDRPALLRDAVEAARAGADRIEETRAFADLGQAYEEMGERGDANRMRRKAVHLARQCGAESLGRVRGDRKDTTADRSGLSEAERRVAALAARGYSNREIAGILYVTVSTVEQHLTRAYRKLKVSRRADLASRLHTNTASG